MKKKLILLIIVFLLSPFSNRMLSHGFMYCYNQYNLSQVETRDIEIPIADGYYPFNLFYNANSDFKYGTSLEIYYNFGDIDLLSGRSKIYQKNDFNNAFYGLYIYNENDQKVSEETIRDLTNFDLNTLVMSSIGDLTKGETIITKKYLDEFDNKKFEVYEATIKIGDFNHHLTKFYPAYLQYGLPSFFYKGSDFETIELQAKLYHYYDGTDNYLYYLIAPTNKMYNYLDSIIKKSIIS